MSVRLTTSERIRRTEILDQLTAGDPDTRPFVDVAAAIVDRLLQLPT